MTAIRVTDHALLRFLARAGGLDIEALRDHLAESLERAHAAAVEIGAKDYTIAADGLRYFIRDGAVVTIEEVCLGRREMGSQ